MIDYQVRCKDGARTDVYPVQWDDGKRHLEEEKRLGRWEGPRGAFMVRYMVLESSLFGAIFDISDNLLISCW